MSEMVANTYDPTKPLWSIMTKSRGGTVSVIRDLTLEQAARTYERLDPWYGHHSTVFSVHSDYLKDGCRGTSSGGSFRSCRDGDIEVREIFGPSGWQGFKAEEIKHWPTYTTIWTDAEWNILPDEFQDDVQAAQREKMMRDTRKPKTTEPPTGYREDVSVARKSMLSRFIAALSPNSEGK